VRSGRGRGNGVHLRVSCRALLLARGTWGQRYLGTTGETHYIALEGRFEARDDKKQDSCIRTRGLRTRNGRAILLSVSLHHMFILETWFPMLWLLLALADRMLAGPCSSTCHVDSQ